MNKLILILVTALSGGSFWLADHAANDLPERVTVADHSLRMHVDGHGGPTVVLEIGLGGALEEWTAVAPRVSQFTTVIAYDRIGGLDGTPMLTGTQIAKDLHAALKKFGIGPPYILVGQSFGGIYNRIFASMYPKEVAGLVLLDPSQEDFIAWMKVHHPNESFKKKDMSDWPEAAGISATLDELKSLGPLPDVPITVVTGTLPGDDPKRIEALPVWTRSHEDWVKTLPHGRHVLDPKSGHGVQVEDPALVVELIRKSVVRARETDGIRKAAHMGNTP